MSYEHLKHRRVFFWDTLYSQCTEILKVCEDKPVEVVRVSCEDVTTERCVIVPEVEEAEEEVRCQ